jgi:copper(I)-binding protein
MQFVRSIVIACALAAPSTALAQVAVIDPWVRGTVSAQKVTGAFMQLKSATDVSLVGIASPAAGIAEIHEMKMDGNVMRMAAVSKLDLPAGAVVTLGPGTYHVMLMDLKQPLKEGEHVPFTLTFTDKGGKRFTVDVHAPVRALGAPASPHKH